MTAVIMKKLFTLLLLSSALSSLGLSFSYGRYTGDDAATQAITGLGFQPDLLIVKADGAYQGWMAHKDMSAGDAKGLVGSPALVTDRISSLDAGGFTVGTHDESNKASVIYYFIAFQESADLEVGSFVGTGSETITGLSFQPEMVWLMGSASGDNSTAVLKSVDHDNATTDWDGYDAWDHIGSMTSDGFSTNWRTNGSATYYWAAFNEGASSFEHGEFTGNASDDREISAPGFQPDFTMMIANGNGVPQFRTRNMAINESMSFDANGMSSNRIQKTTPNGFELGTDNSVNESSTKITWLAYGGGVNALPVELSKFDLAVTPNEEIQIIWETSSEINSSKFEIEKSENGKDFLKIDEVNAAGTSSEVLEYAYIDAEPFEGINYYRLKAVDLDETFEYSQVKTVSLTTINLNSVSSYPNPAIDKVHLDFQSSTGELYFLEIVNANGNTVYQANVFGYEGPNEVEFNISTYQKGIYFIRLFNENKTELKGIRFIKR